MLEESISALAVHPDGCFADATFGGGGHTAAILSRLNERGRVIAFDRDVDAISANPLSKDPRLTLVHNNFRFIENYAEMLRRELFPAASPAPDGPAVFDGILADLGVSSHQFDTAERGFSFRWDAPLDMRMNERSAMTAADLVNTLPEEALARILRLYGEVDGAGKVARLIVEARSRAALRTTGDLDAAVEKVLPRGAEHKVLAKIYQALRIEVNQEMRALEKFLEGAARSLKPGGRLAVITYHSLEDRMVKNFIRCGNVEGELRKDVFGRSDTPLEPLSRKPVVPAETEIAMNTRARSAKLRSAIRRRAAL